MTDMNRLLLTAVLAPTLLAAQSPSARVDSLLKARFADTGPGAAVMVISNGKVVHQRGYGYADIERKTPITATTTFDLASVSKQFTAMAIMMLAERGKLSIDDTLSKFFPELPAYASRITVRHLLTHTSGMPDYMGVFEKKPAGIGAEPSSQDVVVMLSQVPEPLFAPGQKYEYSNSGYTLLGQIVEKASGMSYPVYLRDSIFKPLGMTSTIVSDQIIAPSQNRAISYRLKDGRFTNADYSPLNRIYGDGNVNTSLVDMAKWDQGLYTEILVKQSTLAKAFEPSRLNDGSANMYGFGWGIGEMSGNTVHRHGGSWAGFRTHIVRIPSRKLTVVILANRTDAGTSDLASAITGFYLHP